MTSHYTLSGVATDIITTWAQTARHAVLSAQHGSENLARGIDARFEAGVSRGGARLSSQLRSDLVSAQREFTGFYTRTVGSIGQSSQDVLAQVARLAAKQVDQIAAAASRLQPLVGDAAAQSLRVVAMPPVRALSDLAHGVAGRTTRLTERVLGAEQTKPTVARRPTTSKRARRAS